MLFVFPKGKVCITARVNNIQLMGFSNCLIRHFQSLLKSSIYSFWGFFHFLEIWLCSHWSENSFLKNFLWTGKMSPRDIGKGCLMHQSNWGENLSDFSASSPPSQIFCCSLSLLPNCSVTIPVTQPSLALPWAFLDYFFFLLLHHLPHYCNSLQSTRGSI